MDSSNTIAVVMAGIAVVSLVLHLVVFIKSGAWTMSDRLIQMEARLLNEITDHQEKQTTAADALRRNFESKLEEQELRFDGKFDGHEQRFGETARAMQTKIHEIETWSRDNFVRKNEFEQLALRLENTMLRADAKIDAIQNAVVRIAASVGVRPQPSPISDVP